jgi:hypothetical protein
LAKSDPGNASWQRNLSVSYNKIGDVQMKQGNLPAVLGFYQASLAIREQLAKSDSGNAIWQRDLSVSYVRLADFYRESQQVSRAEESLIAGRAIIARLVVEHPDVPQWQQHLAWLDRRIAALKH